MRKQCKDCLYGGRWGFTDNVYLDKSVTDRHSITNGSSRYYCSLHNTIHRGNKEQRNCKDYERKLNL